MGQATPPATKARYPVPAANKYPTSFLHLVRNRVRVIVYGLVSQKLSHVLRSRASVYWPLSVLSGTRTEVEAEGAPRRGFLRVARDQFGARPSEARVAVTFGMYINIHQQDADRPCSWTMRPAFQFEIIGASGMVARNPVEPSSCFARA